MGHTFIIQHFYNLFKHEIRLLFLSCPLSITILSNCEPLNFPIDTFSWLPSPVSSHQKLWLWTTSQNAWSPPLIFIFYAFQIFKFTKHSYWLIGSIFEVCKINEWDLLPYSYNLSQILSVFSSFLMHNISRKGITQVV